MSFFWLAHLTSWFSHNDKKGKPQIYPNSNSINLFSFSGWGYTIFKPIFLHFPICNHNKRIARIYKSVFCHFSFADSCIVAWVIRWTGSSQLSGLFCEIEVTFNRTSLFPNFLFNLYAADRNLLKCEHIDHSENILSWNNPAMNQIPRSFFQKKTKTESNYKISGCLSHYFYCFF